MTKVIEVVYENGVFKPLEKVDLPQGVKVKIKIIDEKKIEEFIKELEKMLDSLPKIKVDLKKLDELYYEGKMLR